MSATARYEVSITNANEQLEAERELLCGGVRYIRESRAARC